MKLDLIPARDLVFFTEDQAKSLPLVHQILFDDGSTIVTSFEESYYTHNFWEIFRHFQNTKILPKHHLSGVLKGKALDTDTHGILCSIMLESICIDENLFLPVQKEPLLRLVYQKISDGMSKMSIASERNVTSIDILDFVQIAKHPVLESLRAEAIADPKNKIKYACDNSIDAIKTLPELRENGLAKAIRSKMVKDNQVVQCVMLRGYPTEVDGSIFSKPIMSNYVFGNNTLYDFVADSRTAAKSHYYSDTALKDSEYMSRKFQFFASVVEHIEYTDCGTDKHDTWLIGGERRDAAGMVTYPGDLPMLIGKYYVEELGQPYKCIDGSEKHLIGKKIHFRTPSFCKTKNPHHICHVCFGKLSENVSRFSNVGHQGSVSSTKDVTQGILSIKHVNTSSTMVKVHLREHEQKFMNTGKDGGGFYLNQSLIAMKPKLLLPEDQVSGLVDLSINDNIDDMNLARMSSVSEVGIMTSQGKGRNMVLPLDITQKQKPSLASRELLHYLKKNGWTKDENGNFVVEMTNWDCGLPLFITPNKEESFVDLGAAVDSLVRSNQKMIHKRLVSGSPSLLLKELFDLINGKLRINIVCLEIIVYSLMVESTTSYAMGRNAKDPVLGTGELITKYRSLGPALAYENQHNTLTDPISFFKGKRPDNPMDVFLAPQEVMDEYGPFRL